MRKYIIKLYKIKILKRIIPSLLKKITKLLNINEVIIESQKFLFSLNLNNPIDREIYLKDQYELAQILFLINEIKNNKLEIFIDIGSHMGIYTLLLSEQVKYVYSFEPLKKNYNQLKRNIKINNLLNVKYFNIALSDKKKNIDLWVTDINRSGGYSIYDKNDEELKKYKLEYISISQSASDKGDNLLNISKNKIAIKIDVERHEEKVLIGMKKILSQNDVVMQIEIFETRKKKIFNLLKELNFKYLKNIKKDYYFKNF